MSAATDGELMASVQRGNVARLGELFARHHRRLYAFFVRLIGDRAASEDLVQEVFVRMLKYRDTFRADAPFAPWMFTLARNVAHDHRRERPATSELDLEHMAAAPDDEPGHRLEREQTRRRLDAALSTLSQDKREVLALARFGELRYEQIGAIIGSTANAVKVRVHRAMLELRVAYLDVGAKDHLSEL